MNNYGFRNEYEKKKKSKSIISIVLLIVIVVGAVIGLKVFLGNNDVNVTTDPNPTGDNNYVYKIRYDFGCESYIYLYKDNTIKTEQVMEIMEEVPGCDCIEGTGKYNHEFETVTLTDKTKETVIKVFEELAKRSGKNEFNADLLQLSKTEQRTLLAIMVHSEDSITVIDNIKFDKVTTNTNTKMIMSNQTK